MLTPQQELRLETLRRKQNSSSQILWQSEHDEIRSLIKLQHEDVCLTPTCTGGTFENQQNCPKCNRKLGL